MTERAQVRTQLFVHVKDLQSCKVHQRVDTKELSLPTEHIRCLSEIILFEV